VRKPYSGRGSALALDDTPNLAGCTRESLSD
jgi:hypothetical protein